MHFSIDHILYHYSYPTLFVLTFGYFILLYFGIAPLFLAICKFLERKKLLSRIEKKTIDTKQTLREIRHSFSSIVVFGFSILPIIYLIRAGAIVLLSNNWVNVILGIIVLILWNEVHFFVIHRIMHLPFFMRKIHFIHHQSIIPSVYSVYSFHWFEAFLLSTVPLTIMIVIPFSIVAVFLYPLISILLNFSGHCNYRFGSGKGKSWFYFGTHHNEHHAKGRKNYGFALNFLDKLFGKIE